MTAARTAKQAAILSAIARNPRGSDSAIAKASGASRSLVRRVRERMRPAPRPGDEAPEDSGRRAPWPKLLDSVFAEGGTADELEAFVGELVSLGGRLDKRLAALEIQPSTHLLRTDRHTLVRQIYNLARTLQAAIVPAGPCPFCERGCARCHNGRWAPANMVDAISTTEDRNSRRRWWRRPKVEVPL